MMTNDKLDALVSVKDVDKISAALLESGYTDAQNDPSRKYSVMLTALFGGRKSAESKVRKTPSKMFYGEAYTDVDGKPGVEYVVIQMNSYNSLTRKQRMEKILIFAAEIN